MPAEVQIVLVHDAARPFVDDATIVACSTRRARAMARCAALPVVDTLKRTTARGDRVRDAVEREEIWRAQTPQGFPREMIERAHREARGANVHATDDAALCERIGLPVRIVREARARSRSPKSPTSRAPTRCSARNDGRPTAVPFWSPAEVEAASPARIAHLAARRVLAYPTETVYGFGGAIDATSVDALVALKRRQPGKPFLLLVAEARWSTRLDLISPATPRISPRATGPGRSRSCSPAASGACRRGCAAPRAVSRCDGRRTPASRDCSCAYGEPITSTSANLPGSPPAMSASEVTSQWPAAVNARCTAGARRRAPATVRALHGDRLHG